MPRSSPSSSSHKPISSPPIRPPPIMGPIFPGTTQTSHQPSFTQNMKDGLSLGIGMSVARNVIDRMFGNGNGNGNSSAPASAPTPLIMKEENNKCKELFQTYENCVKENVVYTCEKELNTLKHCMEQNK